MNDLHGLVQNIKQLVYASDLRHIDFNADSELSIKVNFCCKVLLIYRGEDDYLNNGVDEFRIIKLTNI